MFAIMFHILEELSRVPSGLTVKTLAERGVWSHSQIRGVLKGLEKEGYVSCDRAGRVCVWTLTARSDETIHHVSRLHGQNRPLEEF